MHYVRKYIVNTKYHCRQILPNAIPKCVPNFSYTCRTLCNWMRTLPCQNSSRSEKLVLPFFFLWLKIHPSGCRRYITIYYSQLTIYLHEKPFCSFFFGSIAQSNHHLCRLALESKIYKYLTMERCTLCTIWFHHAKIQKENYTRK